MRFSILPSESGGFVIFDKTRDTVVLKNLTKDEKFLEWVTDLLNKNAIKHDDAEREG